MNSQRHMKRCSHRKLLEKSKLKPHWNKYPYVFRMTKILNANNTSICKDIRQLDLSNTTGVTVKCNNYSEK